MNEHDELMNTWADRIKGDKRFAYIRFGDGEFNCASGKEGRNRSGHTYTPALRKEINKTLDMDPEEGLFLALGARARRTNKFIDHLAPKWRGNWATLEWLYHVMMEGRGWLIIEALRERDIVLVGPSYFEDTFERIAPFRRLVEVPNHQCFDEHKRIVEETLSACTRDTLVVASYSLPSVALGREVWQNSEASFFDAGSIWEPILGLGMTTHRRSWYAKATADPSANLNPIPMS